MARPLGVLSRALLIIFILSIPAHPARADGIDKLITLEEFHALVAELAPKVNLFRDIWSQDPAAEFFGGTSRDFL